MTVHTSRVARLASGVLLAAVLTAGTLFAYTPYGWKWTTTEIEYYVNPANLDVPASAAVTAIQSAAAAWSAQSLASFSWYFMGYTDSTTVANNGRNDVFFRNGSSGSAIATTYYWYSGDRMLDADIVFWDGTYTFFTGSSGCSRGFYIEDVATHEFGHALGLGHSEVTGATMVAGTPWCGTSKRWLALDDLAGVEALYPPAGINAPPRVTILAPSSGDSLTNALPVTFWGSADDPEEGDLTSTITWHSSVDDLLGSGGSVSRTLSPGIHTIQAAVRDSAGAIQTAQVDITITQDVEPTGAIVLRGTGYKVKGRQRVDLEWDAPWASTDVFRDGVHVATTGGGTHTDAPGAKGRGSRYVYSVCDAGTSDCSNEVTITF